MFRAWTAVGLLTFTLLAGCLEDETALPDLDEVFGQGGVVESQNQSIIVIPAIKGRFVAEGADADAWADKPATTYEPETIQIPKPDPGPQGGGGITRELGFTGQNLTLEVQLVHAAQLKGYEAQWAVVQSASDTFYFSDPQPAPDTFKIRVKDPGFKFVVAQLVGNGKVAASTGVALVASIDVHWVVESSIHPLKPPQGPAPANYEQMADRFTFDLTQTLPKLAVATEFRGSWTPNQGHDIGLEVDDPDGAAAACADSAGTAGPVPMAPPPPDPEQAAEEAEVANLKAGTWTIRVGGMGDGCGNPYYANADSVPYTLDIQVLYSEAKAPKPPTA